MRTAFLIVGGNVLAFALGAVTTVWVLALGLPMQRAPRVEMLASLEKPSTPASGPDSTQQVSTPAPAPADSSAAERARPLVAPPAAAAPPPATAVADPAPLSAVPSQPSPAPPTVPALPVVFAPVAPAAPLAPTSITTAAAPTMAGYVLQLGAFQDPANAARLQAAVRKAGYPADILPARSGGKTWQLVRIVGYPSREAAAAAAASLQRDTGVAALIMKPPLP